MSTTTTTVPVSDLSGAALDWAVAKCESVLTGHRRGYCYTWDNEGRVSYSPSSDWSLAGPIIERERLSLTWLCDDTDYRANTQSKEFPLSPHPGVWQFGPTPLIAAMRCYVASKLGNTVDVPSELV